VTRHTPLCPYVRAALLLVGSFWAPVLLLAVAAVVTVGRM
jgi:hypothetical protein